MKKSAIYKEKFRLKSKIWNGYEIKICYENYEA